MRVEFAFSDMFYKTRIRLGYSVIEDAPPVYFYCRLDYC